MPAKPQTAKSYRSDQTELAEQVLLEVWSKLGEFHEHLVLVGGLVPRYLIPQDSTPTPHTGTMDVDLGISVAVKTMETYESIRETLVEKMGFEEGRNQKGRRQNHSFVKTIGNLETSIDFLTTKYDGPEDSLMKKLEENLSAIQVEGLGLAFNSPMKLEIRGELLSGGMTTETVNICRPIPFIVLKALAFQKRREPKDAYDLVYIIQNYQDGTAGLARDIVKEEMDTQSFQNAITALKTHFRSIQENGPVKYGQFLENPNAATQAFASVKELLMAFEDV